MKSRCIIPVLILISIQGCFHFGDELYTSTASRHYSTWSESDAFNIIATSMSNNFINPSQIIVKVNATGYFPMTIFAIQRRAQITNHWDEPTFRAETDALLEKSLGVYYDWEGNRFMDAKGSFITNAFQIDTIEFMVSLMNMEFPLALHDIPLNQLEERILLVNEQGYKIRPIYVSGRIQEKLRMQEVYFVRYALRGMDGRHLFEKSRMMKLELRDFPEGLIELYFPVEKLFTPTHESVMLGVGN